MHHPCVSVESSAHLRSPDISPALCCSTCWSVFFIFPLHAGFFQTLVPALRTSTLGIFALKRRWSKWNPITSMFLTHMRTHARTHAHIHLEVVAKMIQVSLSVEMKENQQKQQGVFLPPLSDARWQRHHHLGSFHMKLNLFKK